MNDCYGHRITRGKNKGKWSKHPSIARKALEKAKGSPPFSGALCRHLCENDSCAPNGFVCVNPQHLTWGTQQENVLDQDPQVRRERSCKAGKAASVSMTLEQKTERSRKGAYVSNSSPTHPNKLLVICPHCGKVGTKMTMMRYHFDKCKFKPEASGF